MNIDLVYYGNKQGQSKCGVRVDRGQNKKQMTSLTAIFKARTRRKEKHDEQTYFPDKQLQEQSCVVEQEMPQNS